MSNSGYVLALIILIAALVLLLTGAALWAFGYGAAEDRVGHSLRVRFRRELRWVHAHLVLTLVVVALLALVIPPASYQLGFNRGVTYGASYFQQHYPHPGLKTFHARTSGAYAAPIPKNLPSVLSVNISHYPAVGDQGSQGACAAWASAWALSYDFRMAHLLTHPGLKFSPEYLYSWYSDRYNGGQDGGSWPTQDLEMVPSIGVPQYSVLPGTGPILNPFPTASDHPALFANAAKFKMPLSVQTLYQGSPSSVVYDEAKVALSQGQPALLSINVTPSFDAATTNGGKVWYQGSEASRGGHEIVILATDDSMAFPDGSIGGAYVSNQWTRFWGVGGRAWVSRSWLSANGWAILMLQGGTGTKKGKA